MGNLGYPPDFDGPTVQMIEAVRPFTMTSPERLFALRTAVEYVSRHRVPGAVVECGVWRGGSMMAVARTLLEQNDRDRTLYLFDTFDGMSPPTARDRTFSGDPADDLLSRADKRTDHVWAYSPLEEVQRAMESTGYDPNNVRYVVGPVERTLPREAPEAIALLRLDTDWYESTYHELVHLYPRLSVGGVLIIDDYGYWQGAREAVDQYVRENTLNLLFNRIDFTGRIAVKIESLP
jgi:O-methyltransferase